jgi:Tol biopolymer transport system component
MVYFVDDVNSSDETKVALVDRDGKEKPLPFPPTRYSEPRISPDGKQAAVVSDDEQDNGFLSVYELSQNHSPAPTHISECGSSRVDTRWPVPHF